MLKNNDYSKDDIVKFLKEEFERIITQYPHQRGGILREAQAFAIWFLHQEVGVDYESAHQFILDESNDCGVDFIWIDKDNQEILVGQIEYDASDWIKNPANPKKAIDTFNYFKEYLQSSNLPESLHDSAKNLWREAKRYLTDGFSIRYLFITPKYFSPKQEELIREKSGLPKYEFFTHEILLERGHEFLDGQTGTTSFDMVVKNEPLAICNDFCSIYVVNIDLKEIHRIVEFHEKRKRLKALFASNVRGYLNIKKRSKEIADAMRLTIKNDPEHFLVRNNGITLQCSKALLKEKVFSLKRASISNGCQTVMNIDRFFKENPGEEPNASVLVTIIELQKNAPMIAGEIARSRNFQNPIDNRDLMSNDPLLVTLHHRLFADTLHGSQKRYYLLRKQGEKQTILREEPGAKGKFMWIDSDELARRIAAVIRQDPYMSQQGTNDIFGKYFRKIFPKIQDPSHSRCKYAFWLTELLYWSYDPKSKWKGISDKQIYTQRDFKSLAIRPVSALIDIFLKEHFSFNEGLENRFVEKAEKWFYSKSFKDFEEVTFKMFDDFFRLEYAISKTLLGKKLAKARDVYISYKDLLKGPTYDYFLAKIKRGEMKTYQDQVRRSVKKFIEYLKNN